MRRRSATAACSVLVTLPGAFAGTADAKDLHRARERAVSWAVAQAPHRERGTTNCSPRIDRWVRDMGLRVPPCRPWCGALIHQAFRRAGVRLSVRLIDPDRSYADAVARRRGLRAIAIGRVRKGDLLFFRFALDSARRTWRWSAERPRAARSARSRATWPTPCG